MANHEGLCHREYFWIVGAQSSYECEAVYGCEGTDHDVYMINLLTDGSRAFCRERSRGLDHYHRSQWLAVRYLRGLYFWIVAAQSSYECEAVYGCEGTDHDVYMINLLTDGSRAFCREWSRILYHYHRSPQWLAVWCLRGLGQPRRLVGYFRHTQASMHFPCLGCGHRYGGVWATTF